MFDAIAPTYERVNQITSLGRDRHWRRKAVSLAGVWPDDRVLDVACGTGDLARAFAAAGPRGVVGADFAHNMLSLAAGRGDRGLTWCRADALTLPFADESFTIVSCAFGVRNFQDLSRGLGEMYRVLAPGGRAVVLEFGLPRSSWLRSTYQFYFRHVLPRLARLISGDHSGAYDYLPRSVATFLDADEMVGVLRGVGFGPVEARPLTLGVAIAFVAHKPGRAAGARPG